MKKITNHRTGKELQQLTEKRVGAQRVRAAGADREFRQLLRQVLTAGSGPEVSEEELYSALINQRLSTQYGESAAQSYRDNMQQLESENPSMSRERAANLALREVRRATSLTKSQSRLVRAEAFSAAQFDDNFFRLYGGSGEDGDSAMLKQSTLAINGAARALADVESGDLPVFTRRERKIGHRIYRRRNGLEDVSHPDFSSRDINDTDDDSVSTADNTTKSTKGKAGIDGRIVSSSDGPNGFVFKPESDHERKLVVLLPSKFGHSVEGVSLVKRDGELVERGRSSGFANGDREHFRFNLAGSRYPNNILVQVLFKDGDKLFYRIDDPGRRHD